MFGFLASAWGHVCRIVVLPFLVFRRHTTGVKCLSLTILD